MRSAWPEVLQQCAKRGIVVENSFDPADWFKNVVPAEGDAIEIKFANGNFPHNIVEPKTVGWISFLRSFEAISLLLAECHMGSLPQVPFAFFPSERSPTTLSTVLSTSNQPSSRQEQFAQQRLQVGTRGAPSSIEHAVYNMAAAFVRLQSDDIGNANGRLQEIPELKRLEAALRRFEFTWDLRETDPYSRQFAIGVSKGDRPFPSIQASSGESSLLSLLVCIYGTGAEKGLLVIDEPELHLHPTWVRMLSDFLVDAIKQGAQVVVATHSPKPLISFKEESLKFWMWAESSVCALTSNFSTGRRFDR